MPASIRLTGGAARSDVWAGMFADAFGVPVEVPDGTELGALGAAICAAVAAGCHESYQAAVAAMVRFARRYEPSAERTDLYRAQYARYERALQTLAPAWTELMQSPRA